MSIKLIIMLKVNQQFAMRLSFWISFTLMCANLLFAQNYNLQFEKITTKEGLNQNTVSTILQDSQGFLWIGTQNGLNRYDGYQFKLFNNFSNKNDKYASYNITALAEDGDGNIWIGTTSDGVSVLNTKTGKFSILPLVEDGAKSVNGILRDSKNFMWISTAGAGLKKYNNNFELIKSFQFVKDSSSISSNNINVVFEDKSGTIWVGTKDAGLNKLDINTNQIKKVLLDKEYVKITAINQDEFGTLWIGSGLEGLYLLNPETEKFSTFRNSPNNKNSIAQNTIHTIFKDSNNKFWIGTDGGLSLYSKEENSFSNFYHDPQIEASISSDQILSIYEDRTGIIWLGTANAGLNRFSSAYAVFNNYQQNPENKNSLNTNKIWSIIEETPGKLWLGTEKGISSWDITKNIFKHFDSNSSEHSLNHNIVRSVRAFNDNQLLVGTDGGGLNIFDPATSKAYSYMYSKNENSISDNHIRDILKNDDGTYWIATMGGLNLFNPETNCFKIYKKDAEKDTSIADNRILDLYKDSSGNLWVATYNGLSVLKENSKNFQNYYHNSENLNSISNNLTVCIYESPKEKGIIWIGTIAGLNRLDSKTNSIERFLQDGGDKANNVLYSILEDEQGFFWFGTNNGLARFDRAQHIFKNFSLKDGVRNDEFNAGSAIKLEDGRLLFGGIAGITGFKPQDLQLNKNIPNIVITSFKRYDHAIQIDSLVAYNEVLNLSYLDKYISFEFAALDFTNPVKNKYMFMLQGFDRHWIPAANRRYASYTNLDGGEYVFKVKGSNNDGVWNESGTSLRIYVHPPYWETWWFRLSAVLAILFLIILLYKKRTARIRRQKRVLQEEIKKSTKELFLKNSDLKRSQKAKDSILRNVEEGFFLLNKGFVIQSEYSAALLKILEIEPPEGKRFLQIIAEHLSQQQVDLTSEYLDLLFDSTLDEDLISDLNPLNKLEFRYYTSNKQLTDSKYLTFRFNRIIEKGKIEGLIVTVIDETEEFILSKQLRETELKSKKQIEWLMSVLHLDPKMLHEFMDSTFRELESINNLMQEKSEDENYILVLDEIARSLHLIKGNANLLDLQFFAQQVHDLEEKTLAIKETENLSGSDFLPLIMHFSGLKSNLDELKQLIDRLAKFNDNQNSEPIQSSKPQMTKSIANLVQRMADELGKKVYFNTDNFVEELIPLNYKLLVKNILVQFVRNSLAHGIEPEEEREINGKQSTGIISIQTETRDNQLILKYHDDGRGLHLQKLKEKAIESKRWTDDEIKQWSPEQIADVIFVSGISSSESADLYSGRGVGMDIIQTQIEKHNGNIEVNFKELEYCEFTVKLPLVNNDSQHVLLQHVLKEAFRSIDAGKD